MQLECGLAGLPVGGEVDGLVGREGMVEDYHAQIK